MENKVQPPPEYVGQQQPVCNPQQPPTYTPQQQAGYNLQQQPGYNLQQQPGYTPQQQPQGFTQQCVVNQTYPVYPNQRYVVQPGYSVQNQMMYTVGQPNVVVTQPIASVVVNQRPSDYLVCSLLTCFFCFFPTGIAAIVFSCSSKQASDSNDYINGRKHGNMAKILSIISLCIGLLWIIALTIFLIVYFTVIVRSFYDYDYNYNYDY